jgi:hypothetical protein
MKLKKRRSRVIKMMKTRAKLNWRKIEGNLRSAYGLDRIESGSERRDRNVGESKRIDR